MIIKREPEEITEWMAIFYPYSPVWYGRIVPGRFKHVALMSFSAKTNTWIFQETIFSHVRTVLLPATEDATRLLGEWAEGCSVLRFKVRPENGSVLFRGPLTCVSFARHVLGSRCVAITPDQFYRALIRQGATVVHDNGEGRRKPFWRRWSKNKPDDGHYSSAATNPAAAGANAPAADSD